MNDELDRRFHDSLNRIKKALALSWENHLPCTLAWEESMILLDTLDHWGDFLVEGKQESEALQQRIEELERELEKRPVERCVRE